MARDYKIVKKSSRGELVFDEGRYTPVPKNYTPYKYKSYKSKSRALKEFSKI